MNEHEQRLIASISKSMMYVHNKILENILGRIKSVSDTGDFLDVVVIDVKRLRIAWTEVWRVGTEEMGDLMRQMVSRLYTFQARAQDRRFVTMMDRAVAVAWRWDEPEIDEIILSGIELSRRRAEEED